MIELKNLTVELGINGLKFPVDSIEAARKKWIGFRDFMRLPKERIGNGVRVVDKGGAFVARILYDGTILYKEK